MYAVVLYQCINTVIRAVWFQISFRFCTTRPASQGFKILKPRCVVNSQTAIAFATLLNVRFQVKAEDLTLGDIVEIKFGDRRVTYVYSILHVSLVLCLFWWFLLNYHVFRTSLIKLLMWNIEVSKICFQSKGVLWQGITLRCPADLRILEARGLKVNFFLSGFSVFNI